jgi:hypothetical protein
LTSDVDRHNTQQVPAEVVLAYVLGLPAQWVLWPSADYALSHHAQGGQEMMWLLSRPGWFWELVFWLLVLELARLIGG